MQQSTSFLLRIAVVVAISFHVLLLHAEPYGHYDPRSIVIRNASGSGAVLDLRYVDRIISDLQQHAGSYPARFDSSDDEQRARQDITRVVSILNVLVQGASPSVEILIRLGMLTALGHNLRISGSGELASQYLTRALAIDPENPQANYRYGVFLADTARPNDSIPYLEKAQRKGVSQALYSLGLVYLTLNDAPSALRFLEEYRVTNPNDARADAIIEFIRSGATRPQREGNSTP